MNTRSNSFSQIHSDKYVRLNQERVTAGRLNKLHLVSVFCPHHLLSWQNKGREPPKYGTLAF